MSAGEMFSRNSSGRKTDCEEDAIMQVFFYTALHLLRTPQGAKPGHGRLSTLQRGVLLLHTIPFSAATFKQG